MAQRSRLSSAMLLGIAALLTAGIAAQEQPLCPVQAQCVGAAVAGGARVVVKNAATACQPRHTLCSGQCLGCAQDGEFPQDGICKAPCEIIFKDGMGPNPSELGVAPARVALSKDLAAVGASDSEHDFGFIQLKEGVDQLGADDYLFRNWSLKGMTVRLVPNQPYASPADGTAVVLLRGYPRASIDDDQVLARVEVGNWTCGGAGNDIQCDPIKLKPEQLSKFLGLHMIRFTLASINKSEAWELSIDVPDISYTICPL